MLALSVCFRQPCSSAGRRFASSRPHLNHRDHFVRFHKNEFKTMLCKQDSIECARSFEQSRTLPVRLGISQTKANSQWNLLYNAFHRIHRCGNKTIHRQYCKRDPDAANLRPELEQGCGRQTPSARKIFVPASKFAICSLYQNIEETEI